MSGPSLDQLRFILESGILAPSADNHHRLRFETDQEGVNVWYTGGEMPEPGGYKRVLVLLSMGAVCENLVISARRFGFSCDAELFPVPGMPGLIFRIAWGAAAGEDPLLWEEIPRRHTNRSIRYRGPGLSPEERAHLEGAVAALPGCGLTWLDEPRLRRKALGLMRLAEGERFHNRVLHEELFSAVRFDVGWNRGCDEGLPPGALAIEPPLRRAFALMRHWKVMRLLNLVGAYRLLGWRSADLPCRFAPYLAAITVQNADDGAVFSAGRAFQRVWLEITRQGMALHPMPASAIYAFKNAGQEGIPDELRQCLGHGWSKLVPGRCPLMLFRVGRVTPHEVTTGRKPLGNYWRDA